MITDDADAGRARLAAAVLARGKAAMCRRYVGLEEVREQRGVRGRLVQLVVVGGVGGGDLLGVDDQHRGVGMSVRGGIRLCPRLLAATLPQAAEHQHRAADGAAQNQVAPRPVLGEGRR